MIGENIRARRLHLGLTQEALAEQVGVSRQTVGKWEDGQATPDLANAGALAAALGVSLDDLVGYEAAASQGAPMPPAGKHIFGTVTVSERGQVVIPKEARDLFGFGPGTSLVMLGDEEQGGLALMRADSFLAGIQAMRAMVEGSPQ